MLRQESAPGGGADEVLVQVGGAVVGLRGGGGAGGDVANPCGNNGLAVLESGETGGRFAVFRVRNGLREAGVPRRWISTGGEERHEAHQEDLGSADGRLCSGGAL